MNLNFLIRLALPLLASVVGFQQCAAATISTHLESEAQALVGALSGFAQTHAGELPSSWDELKNGIDFDRLKMRIGDLIEKRTLLLPKDSVVPLDGPRGAKLIAMTAFPIHEDRTEGNGRYIVYRTENGQFVARWEHEDAIQKALAKANVSVPQAAVYEEKPIKPLYPEYRIRLVEDAVKHGVPIEQAVKAVEKHIDDVSNRRAKEATTWAEIADSAIYSSTTPVPSIPNSNAPPATPSRPPSPAQVESPGLATERSAPIWPWIVGIAALIMIALFVLKRRA